jgi:hypothetical protein
MFQSEDLDNHLKTSHTIETESAVYAEWNLNDLDNVERLGNYRYRPGTTDNQFSILPSTYDPLDEGGYYTGATQADTVIQSGFDDEDNPTLFTQANKKMELLYSLEECIKPHRPRSGINKLLYLGEQANQYLDIGNKVPGNQEVLDIARRPRYYMASRYDQFKYWTSYRTESVNGEQEEFGVSRERLGDLSYIYDASPFVVYKEQVPTNKIVVKMQTNVGDIDLGPFRVEDQEISDPLFGFSNQTTPVRWKIEKLQGDTWTEIISFDENSARDDDGPIIKNDGYVEISYGIQIPERYRDFFVYAGVLTSSTLLPDVAPFGYAYLIQENPNERGVFKIFDGTWVDFTPNYGWKLSQEEIDIRTPTVTETNNPDYFINDGGEIQFREFDFIRGIRIVAETMNVPQSTFDLIEVSPRLFVNVSEKVSSINLTKTMSDLGNGSIPVGNIQAGVGSVEMFDNDFSFNENNPFNFDTNTGSIVSKYVDMRIKFNFYQIIRNVDGLDYFIPIKSMYTDGIPSVAESTGIISLELRDFFFFLEMSKAPNLLITDASISYAVTLLLDYIGFSNIVFKRIENEPEIIVPFFFVAPDQNVAEVLQQLAVASQTSMFFDEYNNLVVMSKEYLLPEEDKRDLDSTLFGQEEGENLPSIINLSSQEKRIYNDGRINYTTRYIQRSISEYSQAPFTDRFKTYGYKPALLWEVAGKEQLRSQNELPQQSQGYTLSAAPLNTSLDGLPPFVENGEIVNNIIDVGENIDNVSSYNGYFYANGEVIQYDAMEYAITGPTDDGENIVWIKNNQEYQRYFSKLPFNGKMYPTGNLRIFSEPELAINNGIPVILSVKRHGRGQFGTPIVEHDAGINEYWKEDSTVKGCVQLTEDYLFNTSEIIDYPENLTTSPAGKFDNRLPAVTDPKNVDIFSRNSTRNGIIKNFRANKYYTENEVDYFNTARVGTLQSSALVFKGPDVPANMRTADFVSYVYKDTSGIWVFDKELKVVPSGLRLSEVPNEPGWFYINEEKTKKISPEPGNFVFIKNGNPKHFGTRMRIIGKIESTNQKSQTPQGAFPIFETIALNVDEPEKNIQIFGGSGGLAFNLNKDTNVGYYFEIISLTQDNIDQYTGSNKPKVSSYRILSDPKPSVTNNLVTVNTETQIEYQVGQRVQILGLVDKNNPTNAFTPLNGEYVISALDENRKRFRYQIPIPSVSILSITAAEGNGTRIKYFVPAGDTRQTFIKAGDKANIVGLSNSSFNISNATISSFVKDPDGWYFTVSASVTGNLTSQNGTVTYVPLTTTSQTGGTVQFSDIGKNVVSNVYFYKVVADEKREKLIAYSIESNVLSLYFEKNVRFSSGEKIMIDVEAVIGHPAIGGEKIVKEVVGGNVVKIDFQASNLSKFSIPGLVYLSSPLAIPYKLWSGIANILVDDGKFTGQYRFVGEENPTVYDLSAEYVNIGNAKRFFLYINGKQVATVTDTDPLPEYNNMALFVRGSSRCMFENIYALGVNISQNSKVPVATPISKIFGDNEVDSTESFRKYALSGIIQKTYLSGIGSEEPPSHTLYFDEFGTIMREAAYLNIEYDRAFPALYARVMKTFNRLKGYSVSGFYAGSYGADFLIFNCTDTNINLDDTTGNFLRIQGITFTQNTTKSLSVEDYYKKTSSLSDPINNFDGTLINPLIQKEEYNRILNSRNKYGTNEFTIESNYIQTDDAAENVFGWTLDKVTRPKILVGLNTFATFNLQLGDLIKINYKNNDGLDIVADSNKNFVVYNMEYTKDTSGENVVMYLAEA